MTASLYQILCPGVTLIGLTLQQRVGQRQVEDAVSTTDATACVVCSGAADLIDCHVESNVGIGVRCTGTGVQVLLRLC